MVKSKAALSAFDSDDGDSSSIPRFCHQHRKELMGPTGYYARKNGEWVDFEGMHPETNSLCAAKSMNFNSL